MSTSRSLGPLGVNPRVKSGALAFIRCRKMIWNDTSDLRVKALTHLNRLGGACQRDDAAHRRLHARVRLTRVCGIDRKVG